MKKILIILFTLFLMTSCTNTKKNEFQKLYDIESTIVSSMTYEEFIQLTESKTGVVFIGDENKTSKELAKIFCDNLCECDVNKAHFIKSADIKEEDLKKIFDIETINYPIIASFYKGDLVGYYDSAVDTEDVNKYIYDLIIEAYPTVCTEAC